MLRSPGPVLEAPLPLQLTPQSQGNRDYLLALHQLVCQRVHHTG